MASVESVAAPADEVVTIGTWLRFLFGSREAILRVARSRQALWLGLAFVLSAGFAREYDGADLWHEPWHLALPLVASLGTSLILWILLYSGARGRGLADIGFWAGYRTLLTLYWMTAPLAWVYAIPVERFMSPGDAMETNLWLLFGVSVWRVLLITRAVSVWLDASVFVIFFLVMFFADSVAVALAFVTPAPIFNVMGGVRMSGPDAVLASATFTVMALGMMSWLVWLILALVVYAVVHSPWSLAAMPGDGVCVSRPLWGLAMAFLAAGIGLLPIGQPEQQNARRAAELLEANDTTGAIKFMSGLEREDFPPSWDPPPRIGYREEQPDVMDVLTEIERQNAAGWIGKLYIDKLALISDKLLAEATDEEIDRVLTILEKQIPPTALGWSQERSLRRLATEERISAEQRQRITAYLDGTTSE